MSEPPAKTIDLNLMNSSRYVDSSSNLDMDTISSHTMPDPITSTIEVHVPLSLFQRIFFIDPSGGYNVNFPISGLKLGSVDITPAMNAYAETVYGQSFFFIDRTSLLEEIRNVDVFSILHANNIYQSFDASNVCAQLLYMESENGGYFAELDGDAVFNSVSKTFSSEPTWGTGSLATKLDSSTWVPGSFYFPKINTGDIFQFAITLQTTQAKSGLAYESPLVNFLIQLHIAE